MHPNITNIADDKIPTQGDIGSYIYRHGSRLASRAELSPVNTLATKKDMEMTRALKQIVRAAKDKKKKYIIKEEEYIKETIADCKNSENINSRQSIYQGALGPFI